MASRIRVSISNSHTSPLNPAIVGFDFDPASGILDVGQALAQSIAFLWNTGVIGDGSSITDATLSNAVSGAWSPGEHLPWPVSELDVLGSDLSINFGYAFGESTFGQLGGISGLGTSVLVTEQVAAGGRRNGRLYLPYCSPGAIDPNGTISSTARASAVNAYRAFLMSDRAGTAWSGSNGNNLVDLGPCVTGPTGVASPVTGVRVSQVPATLSSRKR